MCMSVCNMQANPCVMDGLVPLLVDRRREVLEVKITRASYEPFLLHFSIWLIKIWGTDFSGAQHCDILRGAAEAGGLLVDAMVNIQDGSKDSLSSVPLMVVENGCGSPCIDLRQVSSELAAAAKNADLVCMLLSYP